RSIRPRLSRAQAAHLAVDPASLPARMPLERGALARGADRDDFIPDEREPLECDAWLPTCPPDLANPGSASNVTSNNAESLTVVLRFSRGLRFGGLSDDIEGHRRM